MATDGAAGVTLIETSVAALTVSVVAPVMPPNVAKIDVEPTAAVVTRPSEPAALLIVAFVVSLDAQVAAVVRI